MSQADDLEAVKRIMGVLVRMPAKPHDEMKVGARKAKNKKKNSSPNRAKGKRQSER